MGRCYAQGGPSRGRMIPTLSWKDGDSHQMTKVFLCFAIRSAHRWGDTFISTTVAVTPMIRRHSILTRKCCQTPISRKIGLHTVFTGAEWASKIHILVKCKRTLQSAMRCAQALNIRQKCAGLTHSRLAAPWQYFMHQWTSQTYLQISDMCLMIATTSVVTIPKSFSNPFHVSGQLNPC
ncbi:hypothetical protein BJV74DRAFT_872562 [Russula compacta]|nr:hypothetical protein BJV74DRAFT_872562 [Russula compacta]